MSPAQCAKCDLLGIEIEWVNPLLFRDGKLRRLYCVSNETRGAVLQAGSEHPNYLASGIRQIFFTSPAKAIEAAADPGRFGLEWSQ